jgi:hypothetical protein
MEIKPVREKYADSIVFFEQIILLTFGGTSSRYSAHIPQW